jgi:hypothetical protein
MHLHLLSFYRTVQKYTKVEKKFLSAMQEAIRKFQVIYALGQMLLNS